MSKPPGYENILGIFLLLCLSATAATPSGKPADCSPRQLASTEVSVGENILVPVEYHGQRLWMVLDLGEPFSLLWPSATESLHLRTATLDDRPDGFKMKIDGQSVTITAAVDLLKIGSYRIARRDFFVDPRARPNEPPSDHMLLGSLGISELWPVDFELDLAHRRLIAGKRVRFHPSDPPGPACVREPRLRQIPTRCIQNGRGEHL